MWQIWWAGFTGRPQETSLCRLSQPGFSSTHKTQTHLMFGSAVWCLEHRSGRDRILPIALGQWANKCSVNLTINFHVRLRFFPNSLTRCRLDHILRLIVFFYSSSKIWFFHSIQWWLFLLSYNCLVSNAKKYLAWMLSCCKERLVVHYIKKYLLSSVKLYSKDKLIKSCLQNNWFFFLKKLLLLGFWLVLLFYNL